MDAELTLTPALKWLVVDVHHQEITLLGAGLVVLFGVATLTADNQLVVRDPDGREIEIEAGRVDPQRLAKLLLRKLWRRKLWRRGKWWS